MNQQTHIAEAPQQFDEAPRTEIHLAEYFAIVKKRRRVIALVIAIVLALTAVNTLMQRPTYQSTTVINVEKDLGTPYDIGDGRAVYQTWDPEFVPTQTRLMQSREVAERAVDRLNLLSHPEYKAYVSGFFKEAKTPAERAKAREELRTTVAMGVQGSVVVTPIRGTNLVQLSVISTQPQLAADIANAISESYIDWNLEKKFKTVGSANKFMTTQSEQLRSDIENLERQLAAYGRSKDIVSMDPGSNVTMQSLGSLNQDLANATADRVGKEARYYELQNARAEAIAETMSPGLISQLRAEQAKLEREYAEKLNLYKPEWPAMQQLKAQIDKSKQNLNSVINETVVKARENARNDYMTARRREESLRGVLQGQKNAAMTQSSNAVEYNNLKIEIESKKQMLTSLLARQTQTEVTSRLSGERISNIRVVDRALAPKSRFRPSYRRNAMLGLFLGFALGLGLAFFLEYLDRSLRTPQQVEQYLQLPALGIIPAVGVSKKKMYGYGYGLRKKRTEEQKEADEKEPVTIELIPHHQPRSTVAEAYRAFRAALLLSRAGGIKSVVITSSLPGEGKSSTASNLAVVLGQIGKRTLLIDADLHKPRQHKVFDVSNRAGLVSVLAQDVDPKSVIQKTEIPNVFLMPAGPITPNPSGLLSSTAMSDFLDTMKKQFDYVIIDTPPLGPVADAIVIGHLTDGVVLTAQAGRTPRELVRRMRDKLSLANVRILGALINHLEEDPVTYEQYYRYYGEEGDAGGYLEAVPTKTAKAG